jgi:Na+-driven multidrug efflux pump
MDNYLRISGYVRSSMVLNIFMSCLTAALLFVFIGVLDMNVDGSAFATCLSMTFCACLAMIPFLRGKAVLKFVRPRLTMDMIRQIVACGSPIFLNNISGRVAAIVMNVVLLKEGGQTAVAAYSVLMYAGEIVNPLLYGMSDSVQPAIGYNWGSGAFGRVRDIAKWSFGACAVVSVLGALGMYLFPEAVASLFVQADDLALMELSVHALKLFATAFVFRWFGFVVQGFFSAIEKPLPASLLSVASAMVFPIIFIFTLSPLGLDGLWLNFTATSICVSAMAFFMLLGAQKRMKHQL